MSSISQTLPGGGPNTVTTRAPGGGPTFAVASTTTTTIVVLLIAPALIWGILLLAGLVFDLAELGSFANPVVGALGIVSIVGLVSASGVALTSRVAARRPARTSGRPGRRALILSALAVSVALAGGGMLAAGFATWAPAAAEQPAAPAAEQPAVPAAPADAPAAEQPADAPLFSVDHTDH